MLYTGVCLNKIYFVSLEPLSLHHNQSHVMTKLLSSEHADLFIYHL